MLSRNDEQLLIDKDAVAAPDDSIEKDHEELVDLVNRGGLIKPSDLVYISCVHAWNLYKFMQNDQNLFDKLMSASNARSVFVRVFLHLIADSDATNEIYNQKCSYGCPFSKNLKQIAIATFNIKAKNFASEENDKIHYSRKRSSDPKQSATARKIKKLLG